MNTDKLYAGIAGIPSKINRQRQCEIRRIALFFMTALFALAPARQAAAVGTWTALAHTAPASLCNALLLSDGTVLCGTGGNNWYVLTPDIQGSYINGAWTPAATTHYTRLYCSTQVLTNGNVYIAGGEYGTGKRQAEWYDPLNNSWSNIPSPASNPAYSDAISKMLPNGNVLQGTTGANVWIYNPVSNTITSAASASRGQDEVCWVRLPNDNILTLDKGTQSEHYVPSQNAWFNDGNTPASLFGWGGELGAGFVLPNGNVFFIGASTHTAIYTPGSTLTAAGTWVAGPEMVFGTNGFGAVDAPAAMMVNGKILCALGTTNGFAAPTSFFEYDYVANAFTQVNGPTGATLNKIPYECTMLDLPDGRILLIPDSSQLYVYTPDGSPLAAGQPVVNGIVENADGSYHLTGRIFNGISAGAAYGDDWQMDSNYPLVRMTNTSGGSVYYARTHGWNSTGVMTGGQTVTTEMTLPSLLPAGTYNAVVVANGNASAPFTFTYSPPITPTGLSAIVGNAQLRVSWNPVPGATAYNVKSATAAAAHHPIIATVTGTNYLDTGLTNGTTYYYSVAAVSSGGPGADSVQLSAVPFGPMPAPAGLTAGPDSYLGVSLSWNAAPGATGYNVKRSNTSGGPYTIVANRSSTDYDDTNVAAGTTYFYVVTALGSGGESGNSAQATATPSSAGDVNTGLAGNWRFDEGAGTNTADSSGNNLTGTLINGPTWIVPGRLGAAALSFVSTNLQAVTVPNSPALNMTGGITLAAWINATDLSNSPRILEKGNTDDQYRLDVEGGFLNFGLQGVADITCDAPATGAWTHVAATWDGSNMVLYINGQPQASRTGTGTLATTSDLLGIGRKIGTSASADYFDGSIDEVRIYSRGLSLPEINTIMHAGDGVPTAPTGLTAAGANGTVNLSWTPATNASCYHVKRSTTNGGPYTNIGSSFLPHYADAGLSNGSTYYYVVSAVNFTNESANSSQAAATPQVAVIFFTDANYSGGATQGLGAGNYTLSQLQAAGLANDSASSCRIPNGWTVVAYQNNNYGGSSWTLTSDTPDFGVLSGLTDNMSSCKITAVSTPAPPTGLAAVAGGARASVSWNPSSGATGYNLKRSTTNGGPYIVVASTTGTSCVDTGLADGTNYFYVVSSLDGAGESPNSTQVEVTPVAPPILLKGVSAVGNNFTLQFQGEDGREYVVETSTNLVNWTSVITNEETGGLFIYTDSNTASPARFYRIKQ